MSPGFFGKVPTHGDFVSRRFSRPLLDVWDRWLQAGIVQSRADLGDGWMEIYLSSPLWHFAIGEGVGMGGAVMGVLMPSVDKVGRHFPFTLATQLPPAADLPAILRGNSGWFQRLDDLARSALAPEFELEAFDAALESPELLLDTLAGDLAVHDAPVSGARLLTLGEGEGLADALGGRAIEILGATLSGYSLWWTEGADAAPLLAVQPGLPSAEAFAGLLTGRWP
jgi:type VI secretion system protein ImpM